MPVSEVACCQKHGCKGCTPSWPKAARRATACRVIRKQEESDETPVLRMSGDDDGSSMPVEGNAATPVDGAAMDKALSTMCRDMTVLAHGKLCLAGSYALHRHLREQGQAGKWEPTDIDIFYCSSASDLDGDELRHRLSLLASRCLLQMLGVAGEDLGDVHECQSSYDTVPVREHVRRRLKYDEKDEARVAAFAREQLMSLCSSEPARSRQCARPALAPDPWAPLGWCSAAMLIAPPRIHLGRYRVRSSIKLMHNATCDRWPPVFNLVDVEPYTSALDGIMENALLHGRSTSAAFADFIIREFDIVPCQVAYFSGDDARLVALMSDAARDAVRDGELRLTGCAFQVGGVRGTEQQLGRIIKYVQRGFRLPAGRLSAAPQILQHCARTQWRHI